MKVPLPDEDLALLAQIHTCFQDYLLCDRQL